MSQKQLLLLRPYQLLLLPFCRLFNTHQSTSIRMCYAGSQFVIHWSLSRFACGISNETPSEGTSGPLISLLPLLTHILSHRGESVLAIWNTRLALFD